MKPEGVKGPSIRVHGPDVREEDVLQAGEGWAAALRAVAANLTGVSDAIDVTVGGVRRACDGCDAQGPSFDLPPGWTNHPNGDDFCPACTAERSEET